MAVIVKGEFMKLKRYFIVWIGVSLMLLNVLLGVTVRREFCLADVR